MHSKGGFFSESVIRLSNLQISKKIFQKNILSLKFKFQVQDSFWEYYFWRFGDLKNELHFLRKATFTILLELEWRMQLSMQNNAIKIGEVKGYQGKCNEAT